MKGYAALYSAMKRKSINSTVSDMKHYNAINVVWISVSTAKVCEGTGVIQSRITGISSYIAENLNSSTARLQCLHLPRPSKAALSLF